MAVQGTIIFLSFILLFAINTFCGAIDITSQQESDRITALPGQPAVNFSQFSGYVTVNDTRGRALFYWLTEATSNPEKLPLVLWLNGGPGCSSIAFGASEEIGPFRINETGASLYLNDISWNKVANLLFLESPAGVGFSYTNTTTDLEDTGDERTAEDSLIFLIRWFARFPQYNHRDFYLVGESYADRLCEIGIYRILKGSPIDDVFQWQHELSGAIYVHWHYIPMLAKKVVDFNNANPLSVINLKGFMVGNADMDHYYDLVGTYQYWHSHSMISDHTYEILMKSCNLNSPTEEQTSDENISNTKCGDIVHYAYKEMGRIDPYSIYTPRCLPSSTSKVSSKPLKFKNNILPRRPHSSYGPCSEQYAQKYYNTPEVQKALHANTTTIAYSWTACSNTLFGNWNDAPKSMLPTYKELMAAGLRIWVYSGDTDSVVPVTATRLSLKQLRLKIKIPWYAWYLDRQVGGWTEVYDGLTFLTIRGAGHEVPHIKPKRAFAMFRSFLAGENLPEF